MGSKDKQEKGPSFNEKSTVPMVKETIFKTHTVFKVQTPIFLCSHLFSRNFSLINRESTNLLICLIFSNDKISKKS